jgi:hypothetical protein
MKTARLFEISIKMPLLVTSAAGVNGDGYGSLVAFDCDGRPLGVFSSDRRIADPRGLAVDQKKQLLFLNSGSDRVLALDRHGKVLRDTGPIPQLNPGGGIFGPDGRCRAIPSVERASTGFFPMTLAQTPTADRCYLH